MTTAIFIITPTEHLNRLIWDIWSSPAPESVVGLLQLTQFTQGGLGKTVLSINYRRAACAELRHSDRNLRTAWFEKGDFKMGIKKKHLVDFYHYSVDVYTHFQHTFMFKQLVKWILHPIIPLNQTCDMHY